MPLREILISILINAARMIIRLGYLILDIPKNLYRNSRALLLRLERVRARRIQGEVTVKKQIKKKSGQKNKKKRKKTKSKKTIKQKKNIRRKVAKRILSSRPLTFLYGVVFAIVFAGGPIIVMNWFKELPSPELLIEKGNEKSTRILDRKGRLLYEIYVDRKYNPVSLSEIPDHVIEATLAVEDDRFYDHMGFRVESMLRALKAIVFEGELQGGSTITQQLVKNVLLSPERTIPRKIKELVLSVMVEVKYSKDEILELYLNNTPYGGTAWGIESASMKYFGKHVSDLDLAEASMLAGLPSAPTTYSPVSSGASQSKIRQRHVLDRMLQLGYIDQDTRDNAYNEELEYAPQVEYINAPHFVTYVRSYLESALGKRYLTFGGLTIYTSLDLDIQNEVQELVRNKVDESTRLGISNGAAVVLDSSSGEILAYVGSIDYFKDDWGAFDIVTAYRQPGSSIKPVTYALAFENGYTPATILEDTPVRFTSVTEVYRPVNYDSKFHGKVTIREALANSYNIPAVKLLNKVGVDNMVALGKEFGLEGWEVGDPYGLSVTLGGKEVRLIDLANVYATLARKGVYKGVIPVLSVEDSLGYEVKLPHVEDRRVVSEETAYLLSNILSDNNARSPAFGSRSSLYVPGYDVAVKTGTTDQKRDNWTFGYNPVYTVGVWVGNNDNTPMNKNLASGLSGAAPIWNSIMIGLLEESGNIPFDKPNGIIARTDEKCGTTEIFSKGSAIPESLCIQKEEKNDDE